MSLKIENNQHRTVDLNLSEGLNESLQNPQLNTLSDSPMLQPNIREGCLDESIPHSQPNICSAFPMLSSSDTDIEVTYFPF